MPRVYLTDRQRREQAWRKEDDEIRARVGAYSAVSGKTAGEIGMLAGIGRSTFYKKLREPGTFSLAEYRRLRDVIGT